MQKRALFITIFFLLPIMPLLTASDGENLVNDVIKSKNQETLQQIASLLILFVTTEPQEVNNILAQEAINETPKARTTALAILKACSINCSLNKLQSESNWQLKTYEDSLNKIYKRIYAKLNKRFRKRLYGPLKGTDLPVKVKFTRAHTTLLSEAPIPDISVWQRLGNFLVSLI